MLSDERSRQVMQLYLNAATAGEFHKLFTTCYEEPAYFNRITKGVRVDTLIDCGAFDGDSIHDFVGVFPNYKRIIAVEPDAQNLRKLRDRVEREGIHDVTTIEKGVGSQCGVLRFHENGASNACLDEGGETEIAIMTVDDIYRDDFGQCFLKMDIEGAELDALYGSEKLIRHNHPLLAVCVYHKEQDLIRIPQYIRDIAGEDAYDYYLSIHGLSLAELVFYAIPKTTRELSHAP